MSDEEDVIMEALAIKDFHNRRPKFKGVGSKWQHNSILASHSAS